MSWPVGTIIVCVDDADQEWEDGDGIPNPPHTWVVKGNYYTVSGAAIYKRGCIYVAEIPPSDWPWVHKASRFRLAEGGACESERARAMQPITTHGKANK